ncbi:uncharacterized protein LOC129216031 [Uloborus diversus]|uniref:uncharacterized protein LOC129216031 n=1 Tax=Uloborus diversus TaxID=327109 RepID=UPI0024098BBA|nr:uncharacterized protein LOC129216031 [Uloborus diversus]
MANNYTDDPPPRKQQTTLSSTLVRCVCITASFIVTACGLLGLGVTCFVIRLSDPLAAPCPFHLTITVFAVAALLFSLSFILLLLLCRRRNRLRHGALLEDLPSLKNKEQELQSNGAGAVSEDKKDLEGAPVTPTSQNSGDVSFAMTQKSADVSHWIEQQKPPEEATEDCFPLEIADGATSRESDHESSEGEMTSL